MKILMLTQLFQPEPNHLKGISFAKELLRLGHQVEVMTGFPNYPGGKIYPGYEQKWCMRETMDGVRVIRVPLFPDHSSSCFRRILCYVSFALSACIPGVLLVNKPDVVHVYQGPATLALPAMLLRLLYNVPYILDIQDLWPESVLSSGMINVSFVSSWLNAWCNLTYKMAARIVVLSPGYKSILIDRGVPESKIEVVYNWCDEARMLSTLECESTDDPYELYGRFNIIYAGNIGKVQALDSVIDAAALLQTHFPKIQFVFVGGGVDAERIKNIAYDSQMTNVKFIPHLSIDKIGSILTKADALIIHLQDAPLCRIGIPQKTQAYLASGRPIIMAVRGDSAELVRKAQAGILCNPEDAGSIANAVVSLYKMTPGERDEMARNGRKYYERYLSFEVGARHMASVFSGVSNE